MRHQIPEMLKRGAGSIINVSSLAGLKGFAGSSGYAATKFGVVGITKAAALEYATEGIRVNAVCPAVVESEMADRVFFTDRDEEFHAEIKASHPMNRIGKSEEVANAILWMASDEASFITGTTLNIDGGAGA
jgi:NAD(P)-dependent dehydrogenase (short-subunit alcohol dehydrogenase family)